MGCKYQLARTQSGTGKCPTELSGAKNIWGIVWCEKLSLEGIVHANVPGIIWGLSRSLCRTASLHM